MSDWEGQQLADLRWHWGSAYLIERLGGQWVAQRRDSHATMSADGSEELLTLIREDYARQPVARHLPSARGAAPPGTARLAAVPGCVRARPGTALRSLGGILPSVTPCDIGGRLPRETRRPAIP